MNKWRENLIFSGYKIAKNRNSAVHRFVFIGQSDRITRCVGLCAYTYTGDYPLSYVVLGLILWRAERAPVVRLRRLSKCHNTYHTKVYFTFIHELYVSWKVMVALWIDWFLSFFKLFRFSSCFLEKYRTNNKMLVFSVGAHQAKLSKKQFRLSFLIWVCWALTSPPVLETQLNIYNVF